MAKWSGKATQAGCQHSNSDGNVLVLQVPAENGIGPGSLVTNLTLRTLRKARNTAAGRIITGEESGVERQVNRLLANPSTKYPYPVLLLSPKNSHALDVAENIISRWQGSTSTVMLCVFADPPRADYLRKLAEEKGFNLHVMSLTDDNN